MNKRILITSGGTGGHVFPAMALAEQLKRKKRDVDLVFAGGGLSTNRYFDRAAFPYKEVSCGSFSSKNPIKLFKSLGNILKGIWESRQIIKDFKPDVVVGFGSYYTFPMLVAAKLCGIPVVQYAADSIPGRVIRVLAPYSAVTGIHFPETAHHLKGKTVEVGLPLRDGYSRGAISRFEAATYYGLDADTWTWMIFGGSQGARALNQLVPDALISLAKQGKHFQVIHFTGNPDLTNILRKQYLEAGIHASVKDFETKMNYAWAASDFVLSRSGASTIAESIAFEVPALLVPYPMAMDNHQEYNALYLERIGGAIVRQEKNMSANKLFDDLNNLTKEDYALVKRMRQSLRDFKQRSPQRDLTEVILEVKK